MSVANWRTWLFRSGIACLLVTALLYSASEVCWLLHHSFRELVLWEWTGLAVALCSLPLILFGVGWKRLLLIAVALVDVYCWFSALALEVLRS
jgi:hypothetical protein